MEKRIDYLATRTINDRFIALSRKNTLTTWSILNGKFRMEWELNYNNSG
jgi:23S rRNA A1618 N6-methylase RlmF